MKIGVQFYTLREKATTLEELSEALKRVADMGYTTVQLSGVCKYEPDWMKKELDKNGLKCALTHWNIEEVKNETSKVIDIHRQFNSDYIGLGSMPYAVNEENTLKFIEEFKEPARIIKEGGSKLFYHNHHWEFSRCSDREMIIDKLLNAFAPDELGITLDTFWAQYGGVNPSEFIEKLKGRIECIHLKDMEIVDGEQRMAPVGQGAINFEKVIKSAEDSGAKYLLVEQDNCYGKDPFECLKQSYEYLKALGLN